MPVTLQLLTTTAWLYGSVPSSQDTTTLLNTSQPSGSVLCRKFCPQHLGVLALNGRPNGLRYERWKGNKRLRRWLCNPGSLCNRSLLCEVQAATCFCCPLCRRPQAEKMGPFLLDALLDAASSCKCFMGHSFIATWTPRQSYNLRKF